MKRQHEHGSNRHCWVKKDAICSKGSVLVTTLTDCFLKNEFANYFAVANLISQAKKFIKFI
jgi:hypothetical protein